VRAASRAQDEIPLPSLAASGSRLKILRRGIASLQSFKNWRCPLSKRKKQEAVQHKKAESERRAKREAYPRTLAAELDQCW
jgi:hypothetical protein